MMTEAGREFQPVGVRPPYKSWFDDYDWVSFTFDQKDMDNQRQSRAIGVAGSLDGSYGLFRVSGDGSYEKDAMFVKTDQAELRLSCKLLRVALDRPWMNPRVLSSRAWRWDRGTPADGTYLSTGGDIRNDVVPKGTMTVLPTAAILARGLEIRGSFGKPIVDELNSLMAANASVGIGPFSVAGRLSMADQAGARKGTITTSGISAPDVQLVGFICDVLPRSPDPDPTLPWPSG